MKYLIISYLALSVSGCSATLAQSNQEKAHSQGVPAPLSLEKLAAADALFTRASTAREEKKFSEAARLFLQAVDAGYWEPTHALHAAAASSVQAGELDQAFASLNRAVESGYRHRWALINDSELAPLHADARWKEVLAGVQANEAQYHKAHGDPASAPIETSDIALFLHVQELTRKAPTLKAKAELWRREYLEKGSPGLLYFYRGAKIENEERLAKVVEAYPRFYASLAANKRYLDTRVPQTRASYARFKLLYPDAIFPPTYFVVGHFRSSGTSAERGPIVAAEVSSLLPTTPLDEFSPQERKLVSPVDNLFQGLLHELVHYQQHLRDERTLLEGVLVEGGADFIADLVSPAPTIPEHRIWGQAHAREVWERFQREMDGKDESNWIANNHKATPEWPATLGYYIGYEIARAYYEQAQDKQKALRNLITLEDPKAILRESRYAERFVIGARDGG